MTSPYRDKLKEKAKELKEILKKEKINASLIEDSFEEYCVSLKIKHSGKESGIVKIYYSPNKDSFKYVNKIENKILNETLLRVENGSDIKETYTNKGYEIDVDGSYRNGKTGYGAIIRKDGKIIKKLNGIVKQLDVDGSRQIAGELKAVIESVKYCKENKIDEVTIYYDYAGIESWARGKWMAKKDITKKYAMYMNKAGMKIKWVKIKSHTGVFWNEEADKLAAEAINN